MASTIFFSGHLRRTSVSILLALAAAACEAASSGTGSEGDDSEDAIDRDDEDGEGERSTRRTREDGDAQDEESVSRPTDVGEERTEDRDRNGQRATPNDAEGLIPRDARSDAGSPSAVTDPPAQAADDSSWGSTAFNGVGQPGTPASAAETPSGTPCEEFSHVNHLPWDNRPPECATGDYCLKWDGDPNEQFPNGPEDVIPGGTTWFTNPVAAMVAGPTAGLAKIAIVTCKIGNQCLRFYGQNNCHYDLYDPDTNTTVKPPYIGGEDVPYAIKDGHDYLNFRVRLPGSDTVYNFMNVDANAAASPYYARYCPADAARNSVVGTFDPLEGNQAFGCGPDSPYHPLAALLGETRQPIPYPPPGRSEYDWTYKQDGPEDAP